MKKVSSPTASASIAPLKPEETVRQQTAKRLLALGWTDEQLQWKPEWQVPKTPHDLTKRERGQKYEVCGGADLEHFPTGMNRVGIPKTARVRFKLHAGEGGQHVWPGRFRLIFVKG
ncbi:hypothetical protein WDM22_02050 [Bradyrhizobium septentrionale]|uniref:hypothetical protein n=1 Tax=Bradyrhizobium septentrionale TaxID=1404411 RepID=UPI0030D396F2